MGRPLDFKMYGGAQEPVEAWQTRHINKPRKFAVNTIKNGECKVITPADPQKLAAYKASVKK